MELFFLALKKRVLLQRPPLALRFPSSTALISSVAMAGASRVWDLPPPPPSTSQTAPKQRGDLEVAGTAE